MFPRRKVIFTTNPNVSMDLRDRSIGVSSRVKEESRSPDRVESTNNVLLREFLKLKQT